jgi:hypothetical protein
VVLLPLHLPEEENKMFNLESIFRNLTNPMAIAPNAISRSTGGTGNFAADLTGGRSPEITGILGGTSDADIMRRLALTGAVAGGGLLAAPSAAPASQYSLAGGSSGFGLNPASAGIGLNPASTGGGLHAGSGLLATPVASTAPTTFQSVMGVAKPIGEAAIAANAVNSLLGGNRQPMPPSPMMQPQPNSNLNQIVSGNDQQSQFIQQQNEQERARRMALLANLGGYRGTTR